jgi:cholesterol transport system auxiliary component
VRALGVVSAWLAITGCTLLAPPPKVVVEKSVLSDVPSDVPQRASRGDTVLVFAPRASPLYDTTQMAYSTRPHEVAYFSEREWAATPPQMLYPLVVRALESTHAFRAVLTEPFAKRYTYALRTEILQLIQDFNPNAATLVLTLRFQLTDYAANTVIASKEVSVREPMDQRNSYAGVIAANAATAKALQQMAQYVLEATEAPSEQHPGQGAWF